MNHEEEEGKYFHEKYFRTVFRKIETSTVRYISCCSTASIQPPNFPAAKPNRA